MSATQAISAEAIREKLYNHIDITTNTSNHLLPLSPSTASPEIMSPCHAKQTPQCGKSSSLGPISWPESIAADHNQPSCLGSVIAFSEPLKLPPSPSTPAHMDLEIYGKDDGDCSDDSDCTKDRFMLTDEAQVDIERLVSVTACNAYPRSSLVATLAYTRSISTPSFVSEAECTASTASTSSSSTNASLDDHSSHSNSHGSLVSSCSSKNSFSTGNLCQLSDGSTVIVRKNRKRSRRVSIDRAVSVMPIPSRGEYPELVRERLWSNPLEMYQNAARNSIEFAAEGWDWRKVYEDENMYVCSQSGELIHPIHYYLSTMNDASSP